MPQTTPVKIEAVDLHDVDVLEDGIVPSWLMSTECVCDGCKQPPGPTEPDTLPGIQ